MKNQNYKNVKMTYIPNLFTNRYAGLAHTIDLNGLWQEYIRQKRDWQNTGIKNGKESKKMQFAIQPQASGKRLKKDEITEYSQVCFIDIDSKDEMVANTPLRGITDIIMEHIHELIDATPFIYVQKSISGGIHVIAYIDHKVLTEEEYKANARFLTAYFCHRVHNILGVDLTSVNGVVDTHNINPAQCLLVSPNEMICNTGFVGKDFTQEEREYLAKTFPVLFEKEREGKPNQHTSLKEYSMILLDETKRYSVAVKKVHIEHLGNTERYKLATSLKTLVSSKSLSLEYARKIFDYIVTASPERDKSYEAQRLEFESIMKRKDIKPIISFSLLRDLGISVIENH